MGQRTSTPTRCHHKCSQILIRILLIFLTRGWSLIKYFLCKSSSPHLSGDHGPFNFCTYGYTTALFHSVRHLHWSHLGRFRRYNTCTSSDWSRDPGCLTHSTTCQLLIGWHDKWVLWWTVTTQSVSQLVVLIGRHQWDMVRTGCRSELTCLMGVNCVHELILTV